ncbi:unnamed protein product [Phaedon cochleariae]|uniref:CHK kinase-like domain-containing protein n=1 Tax=Phaedon cochleariae TaxID=80249 RepID=A0A9P0GQZ9_PHACE|nr:unnamed protein product [Phaedon cochleariae]
MNSYIPADIRDFLEKSVGGNLDDFQVETHNKNTKGEGFLSEFLFVSLTNRKTNEVFHLAVKQALASGTETSLTFVNNLFHTELWFYEHIWPELRRFQDNFPNAKKFLCIPKVYAANEKKGSEKISFENMEYQGFRNHDKSTYFRRRHLEYILRTYGQFHAISMAYRVLDPENFRKICGSLVDNYKAFGELQFFKRIIDYGCQTVLSTFDEMTEKEIIDKFRVYAEKGSHILQETSRYNGKNQVVTHGDAWSNNLMFKYHEESDDIEDIRIIDFQFSRVGTVVFDISFCIYDGVSGENLDDLDHYLRVYHQSLSESLRKYNLDPEQVYSYDEFQQEWKRYSKFGLILAIMIQSFKNILPDSVPVVVDLIDKARQDGNRKNNDEPFATNREKVMNAGRNLVLHFYGNDFL